MKIKCNSCQKEHKVSKDKEAPHNAKSMWCNWCPSCEDTADDYYKEGYILRERKPKPKPKNQLKLL